MTCFGIWLCTFLSAQGSERPRARDFGVRVGVLEPGPLNAITDVPGVLVGQVTRIQGDSVRTGITAILPHAGNIFQDKVPAAVYVANGFGKLAGSTQVNELGNLESPIVLTNTLSVARAVDAILDYLLALPGNEKVASANAVVGETNDGFLNDIRARVIQPADVIAAIRNARGGPPAEGNVGAGTGTQCFGFKGGIGTASRRLPSALGGYLLGVLVQTNYGGTLQIGGAPVGVELDRYYLKQFKDTKQSGASADAQAGTFNKRAVLNGAGGSCMIVVATDAPLTHRNLMRLARRAVMGLARTGSSFSNGSGDYAIAFSTARSVRVRHQAEGGTESYEEVRNDAVSPLFEAAIEATEEAVYNSLFRAQTMTGFQGHKIDALPLDQVREILRKYGLLK
ncbi:MAG TPA: P1 family peptidase [Acidobacteriota bacterium]